jgi:hypothetical protein
MAKGVLWAFIGLCILSASWGGSYWVDDPVDCPTVDPVYFPGQSCSPTDICGNLSGTAQCYDTSAMTAPVASVLSVTDWSAGFDGGYLVDCYAVVDGGAPFCDNGGAAWCDRNSTCQSVQYRQTNCTGGSWGVSVCGSCRSGYYNCWGDVVCEATSSSDCQAGAIPHTRYDTGTCSDLGGGGVCECDPSYFVCDGAVEDGDGCEHLAGASCGGGTGTKVYEECFDVSNANCTSAANSDCDDSDGDGNPRTCNVGNGCEIISGASCGNSTGVYAAAQCVGGGGNCTASGSNIDCNDDDSDSNELTCNGVDGCEVVDGSACVVGGLNGTVVGCSGGVGNCVLDDQDIAVTGHKVSWSGANFLWLHQFSLSGWILNLTNASNGSMGVDAAGCLVLLDGTRLCGSGDVGGTPDLSGYINSTQFDNTTIIRSLLNYINTTEFDNASIVRSKAGLFSNLTNFSQDLTAAKICIFNDTNHRLQCDYTDLTGGGLWSNVSGVATYYGSANITENLTVNGTVQALRFNGSNLTLSDYLYAETALINYLTVYTKLSMQLWERFGGDAIIDLQNPALTTLYLKNNFIGGYVANLNVEGAIYSNGSLCTGATCYLLSTLNYTLSNQSVRDLVNNSGTYNITINYSNVLNHPADQNTNCSGGVNCSNVAYLNQTNIFSAQQNVRSVVPTSDSVYDLGDSSYYFDELWSDDVRLDSSGGIKIRETNPFKSFVLYAHDGVCRISGGCSGPTQFEYVGVVDERVNMVELVFPYGEESCADWVVIPPTNWDKGKIRAQIVWNTDDYNERQVEWCMMSQIRTHREFKDSVFGDPACLSSLSQANPDQYIFADDMEVVAASDESGAPILVFRVCRTDGGDMEADARLVAVYVRMYENQYNEVGTGVP